jgi:hypothetical protein
MADDEPDDRLFLCEAMEDAKVDNPLDFALDGENSYTPCAGAAPLVLKPGARIVSSIPHGILGAT